MSTYFCFYSTACFLSHMAMSLLLVHAVIHTLWVLEVRLEAVLRNICKYRSMIHLVHEFFYSPFSPKCLVHSLHLCNGWTAIHPYLHCPGGPVPHSHSKCHMASSWWQLTPEWEWHHCRTTREKWQHNHSPLHNWSSESISLWELHLPRLHFHWQSCYRTLWTCHGWSNFIR